MKWIGMLYGYELKKIIRRKIVWIVGIIMIFLCIFLGFSDLISSDYYYGENKMNGFEAMKINREYARNLAGRKIDDALLREMQDYYSREDTGEINDSISNRKISIIDKGIKEYTPIYSYVREIIEDSNMVLKIDSDELYKMRENSILQNRIDQMLTKKEMDYWKEKDKQIKTPFTYERTESWSNLWSCMYTINYMILLMLAICLSNVFSVEYLRKTDAIILCSRYGKKHLYLAKILAGISFGIITAILFFGITAISNICVYGADGFSATFQIAFPLSSWSITIGESVLVLLFVLLIISVLYSVAIMILSEILKNSVAVMAIPVGIMILTMMIDIPYQFRIASQIYDLLPTNLLTVWELWDDRLVSIFGKYLTNFQIAPIIYLIIIALLFFSGKNIYQKYEIGAR